MNRIRIYSSQYFFFIPWHWCKTTVIGNPNMKCGSKNDIISSIMPPLTQNQEHLKVWKLYVNAQIIIKLCVTSSNFCNPLQSQIANRSYFPLLSSIKSKQTKHLQISPEIKVRPVQHTLLVWQEDRPKLMWS